jgi:putative CocE/NonD family hydrolase
VNRRLALLACLALVAGLTQTSVGASPAPTTYDQMVLQNVFVETRYGDKMNIDICLPSLDGETVAPGRFPVVAELSPYVPTGQADCTGVFAAAVKKGYVGAHVNSPGSGESQGGPWDMGQESYALRHYDAIEWLGAQDWSTGKVGTIGGSGVGVSQLQTAPYRPPSLVTMIPIYSSGDSYKILKPGGMRHATELLVCSIPGAMVTAQNGLYTGSGLPTPPSSAPTPPTQEQLEWMLRIKKDQVTNLQGQFYCPPLQSSWAHPVRDGYWDDATAELDKVTIPTWVWGSQDDLFSLGTQDDYALLGSKDKMLTFGFASHAGDKPGFDQTVEALRWFDYWLKGIDTGIKKDLQDRRFRYNVFPDFQPKQAKDFPIPGTEYTPFYLNGGAPDPLAQGSLTLTPPTEEGSSQYVYTPTDGKGYNPFGAGESNDQRLETGGRVSYLFDPVAEDTEVTGPITMRLYASTTSADTDFVGKLLDVAPDGTWTHVPTNGYLKSTFRTYKNDYRYQSDTPTGEVVAYDIEFYPTSWGFKKGHRIGLALSSGDLGEIYPNPNPAVVTIHHSPEHPSAITLPVIP